MQGKCGQEALDLLPMEFSCRETHRETFPRTSRCFCLFPNHLILAFTRSIEFSNLQGMELANGVTEVNGTSTKPSPSMCVWIAGDLF